MYILLYLLKLSVTIMVISSFYWLILRKLTFYRWNRIFLLAYPALAFLMPFLNVYDFMDPPATSDENLVQSIPVFDLALPVKQATVDNSIDPVYILPVLLTGGLIFFMGRLLINVYSLIQLKRSSVLLQEGPVKIYALKDASAHFSFGNSIFINPERHTSTELERIVLHEYTHVKQKHTYDILWAEFLCIIMWFNPFAWLLRKCIRQNLEFLADQEVIEQGIAPREYQLLLLKVIGVSNHLLATPFGLSFLKKRIAMMNKNKTARIHTIKFLFVLPFLTILILSFRSVPALSFETVFQAIPAVYEATTDTVPVTKKAAPVADTATLPKLPAPPVIPVYPATPVVPAAPATDPVTPAIPVIPAPPAPPIPRIRLMISNPQDLELKIADVNMKMSDLNIENNNRVFITRQANDTLPMFIMDGQVIYNEAHVLQRIDPTIVESINIIKDSDAAVQRYGTRAKGGVVFITTKGNNETVTLAADSVFTLAGPVAASVTDDPVVIYNGKQLTYEAYKNKNVDPATIKSVDVYKGDKTFKKYGSKSGVIIITSK